MNKILPLLLLCALPLASAFAEEPAQPAPRPKLDKRAVLSPLTETKLNVPYVAKGTDKQTLDIYGPNTGGKKLPVVLYVHGGEWTKGDKADVAFKPRFLNEHEVVFVSINYRLSGTDHHPAQVNDIAAAIRWTRDHIADYGGDPEKLVLIGTSAGAHLVTLVGLDPRPLATAGLKPADLRGVAAWSGSAYDLAQVVKEQGVYADPIKTNFGPTEADWKDASPMAHVADTKAKPLFLILSAEDDKPAAKEASEQLAKAIESAGGKAGRTVLPGVNHGTADYNIGKEGDPAKAGEVLLKFVDDSLAK